MISFKNLSKKFDRDFVVKDINLSIKPGEIIGFLGPNGAGKTTTLRMTAGVLPPTLGQVLIKGKDINKDTSNIKNSIGFLPENNPLYDEMTVEEYLNFFSSVKGIDTLRRRKELDFVVENCGLNTVFYRFISELSKGFRQRVGLAQALLTRPEILILDEPTEGLDPNQRREIASLIKTLGRKRTVIISSHVLAEVSKICNRLIIIHKGKIVADGTFKKLQSLKGKKQTLEVEIIGAEVISKLKEINGVSNVEKKKKNYFVITTEEGKDLREKIYKTAVSNKWTLLTMVQKEKELEEVFRQLTSG